MSASYLDRLKVWPQYLLPQHFLSRCIYRLMRSRVSLVRTFLINAFIRIYKVDMSDAVLKRAAQFDCFNAFFTRALQPDARPFDGSEKSIISPVDGFISKFGRIDNDTLIQAKGQDYSLLALLGNDDSLSQSLRNGCFMTLYLSPRNYHRIHMPTAGQLQCTHYVPGRLFAVNLHTTRVVKHLFSRNERLVTLFNSDVGNYAVVLVGAIFVGNIETVWAGEVNSPYPKQCQTEKFTATDKPVSLNKGDELGRFNMGSTVILLFPEHSIEWLPELQAGQAIRMGETLATTAR